jgi:hypothetical protein
MSLMGIGAVKAFSFLPSTQPLSSAVGLWVVL